VNSHAVRIVLIGFGTHGVSAYALCSFGKRPVLLVLLVEMRRGSEPSALGQTARTKHRLITRDAYFCRGAPEAAAVSGEGRGKCIERGWDEQPAS
jgi:hypothetical protein